MGQPRKIGIVGLGVISQVYLETLTTHPAVQVTTVADLDRDRADRVAADIPGARAATVADLVSSDDVDLVLNLTIPAAHAEIALAAISHGKDVYGEKPLAATFADGAEIIRAGAVAGVRVGSAPDTVLGTGTQTARALIDAGRIGRPLAASAVMVTPGHEAWHPNPDFYYRPGGGPLLDMGPYYLSALVHLLGPVRSVTGASSQLRSERVIAVGPRAGEVIPVDTPTHVSGVLEHHNGALSTITTSFDSVATTAAPIEVHGETGSISVPDPNQFDGDVLLHPLAGPGWQPIDPVAGYTGAARGVGLLDSLTETPRATGELALHVLEVMTALLTAAETGVRQQITTGCTRPVPIPLGPVLPRSAPSQ